MLLEILFIMDMFLWGLTVIPHPSIAPYSWARQHPRMDRLPVAGVVPVYGRLGRIVAVKESQMRRTTMRVIMFVLALAAPTFALAAEVDPDELATAYNICHQHARVVGQRWVFPDGFAECGNHDGRLGIVDYYQEHKGQREKALLGWQQSYVHGVAKHLK